VGREDKAFCYAHVSFRPKGEKIRTGNSIIFLLYKKAISYKARKHLRRTPAAGIEG